MAGKTHWTSHSDINKHPEDSLLLAYLRKQQLEDALNISQHIDVDKCSSCIQKLNELKQVSTTLDVLGEMRSYQHYPELSVADTYARMQSAMNHRIPAKTAKKDAYYRQRPRKSAVRLISVPAAFGLAILLTIDPEDQQHLQRAERKERAAPADPDGQGLRAFPARRIAFGHRDPAIHRRRQGRLVSGGPAPPGRKGWRRRHARTSYP